MLMSSKMYLEHYLDSKYTLIQEIAEILTLYYALRRTSASLPAIFLENEKKSDVYKFKNNKIYRFHRHKGCVNIFMFVS